MKNILINTIRFYQLFLRNLLTVLGFGSDCCYIPTCSEYSKEAFLRYGTVKASWFSVKRISRCAFCNKIKHDPLP